MAILAKLLLLTLFNLFLLSSFSYSQPSSNLDTLCDNTPHRAFCKSTLEKNKPSSSLHDHGRFTINQSLSTSDDFLFRVKRHILSSRQGPFVSKLLMNALENCELLAGLTIDFLTSTSKAIRSTDSLGRSDADNIQTMLSTTLTNLDTCNDGLVLANQRSAPSESNLTRDLDPFITNGSMLYSVALALFVRGWVPKSKHGQGRLLLGQHENRNIFFNIRKVNPSGYLPLKFDHQAVSFFNRGKNSKRRLLQLGDMGIIVNTMVVVNKNGSGNFSTINDAVNSAPNNTKVNKGYFGIYVIAGVYDEVLIIPSNKKYLLVVGDGINQTIITGNRSMATNWTTYDSATVAVNAVGFAAVNITFRNTAGPAMGQAVALRSGADLSTFYKCSFEAYQDTLYTHSMRQFYRECDVYGTVDFIFGNAALVLQKCNIYPRQPLKGQFNAITAQGRLDPNQNTGTSIHNCTIQAASNLASSNYTVRTYLGRPWKEYSRTVFMQSFMDSLIEPAGWHAWTGTFALDTLYYAEFNNTGPGSNTTNRVTWLGCHVINETDANNFTVSNFLVGDFWIPATGVPYTGSLIYT